MAVERLRLYAAPGDPAQLMKICPLAAVAVTEEGALAGLLEGAPAQEPAAAAAGGQALLAQFFGLLYTFVGEALTRRLLADAWPDAPVATPPPVRQETTP